ncbi:hypothetical protein EKG37_21210 [Robertmurraya yapensis]|uniref:Uncharacterized protein n=1 Tax=Bacillus yapensis TaxID=2492960 RepID=A0A431VTP7_9BACI|nr:hypothetical protein [Bacillus yapensis]RTR26590.1 hypothetical protein EKG37_21210 [Bacillus yapensis]TKS93765.1 hypothetical protein FAR12_21215 [Bacillus yapensis]
MSVRNVVPIQININADNVVTYEEGLSFLQNHSVVKELGFKYLTSVNDCVDLLDLTRATFERNILENEIVGTGVRHLHVTGVNFPRTRIYIEANDLIQYLIDYCSLTYWKKEKVSDDEFRLNKLMCDQINKEDIEYLARALMDRRFKSNKQLEFEYKRTRPIVSRLSNIIESLSFSFPGSQRQLKRIVLSPADSTEQMEEYFTYYKSYENKIVKVD